MNIPGVLGLRCELGMGYLAPGDEIPKACKA